MKCIFCENPIKSYGEYFVCDRCKTVSFTKDISMDKKRQNIKDYIDAIQLKALEQRGYLCEIEQKHLSKIELQPNEEEIRTNMLKFQSIRSELELYVNTHSKLSSKRERKLLYKLLMLSDWLTKYFLGE